jgi:hypothetical protein
LSCFFLSGLSFPEGLGLMLWSFFRKMVMNAIMPICSGRMRGSCDSSVHANNAAVSAPSCGVERKRGQSINYRE